MSPHNPSDGCSVVGPRGPMCGLKHEPPCWRDNLWPGPLPRRVAKYEAAVTSIKADRATNAARLGEACAELSLEREDAGSSSSAPAPAHPQVNKKFSRHIAHANNQSRMYRSQRSEHRPASSTHNTMEVTVKVTGHGKDKADGRFGVHKMPKVD